MTEICKRCGKKMNIPKGHADLCYDCDNEHKLNEIKLSKVTKMSLDNLRREIVEIVSRTNDIDLMKKVEKCSYDKLILLLNVGFSETAFYNTLNGSLELKVVSIEFTEKSKEILNKLLEEKK